MQSCSNLRGCSTQSDAHIRGLSNVCVVRPPLRTFMPSRSYRRRSCQQLLAAVSASAAAGNSEPPPVAVPEGIREPMTTGNIQSEDERRKKLWFAAIKPPMYTVAIIPILVSLQLISACSAKSLQLNTERRLLQQLHTTIWGQCRSAGVYSSMQLPFSSLPG